jgi:hypothetical protein
MTFPVLLQGKCEHDRRVARAELEQEPRAPRSHRVVEEPEVVEVRRNCAGWPLARELDDRAEGTGNLQPDPIAPHCRRASKPLPAFPPPPADRRRALRQHAKRPASSLAQPSQREVFLEEIARRLLDISAPPAPSPVVGAASPSSEIGQRPRDQRAPHSLLGLR